MVNHTKYNLVLVQKYNKLVHGMDNNTHPDIETHFICHYIFTKRDMNSIKKEIKNTKKSLRSSFESEYNVKDSLQIAEIIVLDSGECVAILKTFWLRIFLKVCIPILQNTVKRIKLLKQWRYRRIREISNNYLA
jgi:hypothetical protein